MENTRLRFESGSLETLKRIVEKQFGYTFLPELATVDMEMPKIKYLKSFQKPEPMREVSLITHRSFIKKRLINLLFNEIKAHIPPHLLDKDRGRIVNI
jgi:LysR family hydrogen peroxide-inducible transcriptional activator